MKKIFIKFSTFFVVFTIVFALTFSAFADSEYDFKDGDKIIPSSITIAAGDGYGARLYDLSGNEIDSVTLYLGDYSAGFVYKADAQIDSLYYSAYGSDDPFNVYYYEDVIYGDTIATYNLVPLDGVNLFGIIDASANVALTATYSNAGVNEQSYRMIDRTTYALNPFDENLPCFPIEADVVITIEYPIVGLAEISDSGLVETRSGNMTATVTYDMSGLYEDWSLSSGYAEDHVSDTVATHFAPGVGNICTATSELSTGEKLYEVDFSNYSEIPDEPLPFYNTNIFVSFSLIDEQWQLFEEEPVRVPVRTNRAAASALSGAAAGAAASAITDVLEPDEKKRSIKNVNIAERIKVSLEDTSGVSLSTSVSTSKILNEKGSVISGTLSASGASDAPWKFMAKVVCKDAPGALTAVVVGSTLTLTAAGKELKGGSAEATVILLGWSVGSDGKLYKAVTAFETELFTPGLSARKTADGLCVRFVKSDKLKAEAKVDTLSEDKYTVEGNTVTLKEDPKISCTISE